MFLTLDDGTLIDLHEFKVFCIEKNDCVIIKLKQEYNAKLYKLYEQLNTFFYPANVLIILDNNIKSISKI